MAVEYAHAHEWNLPTLLFTVLLLASHSDAADAPSPGVRYRAAVVEIYPAPYTSWDGTAAGAVALMMMNVKTADEWAGRAAAQGAQIVVFPEDFISSFGGGGPHWRSKYITPPNFAEPLPEAGITMCGADFKDSPVASALACIAKKHDLVLVVGLGITAPCVPKQNAFDGRLLPCNERSHMGQFDGAAAFGRKGELLGSYSKSHLAYTWRRNADVWMEAADARPAFFDAPLSTGVVRFGFIIDNDANFGDPMLSLLEHGVRDVVAPMCLLNPGYSSFSGAVSGARSSRFASGPGALAFQSALASGYGINLLAANGRMGAWVSGSGIWPADRTLAPIQHYDRSLQEGASSRVAQYDAHSNGSTTTTICGVVGERLGCGAGGESRAWLGVLDLVSGGSLGGRGRAPLVTKLGRAAGEGEAPLVTTLGAKLNVPALGEPGTIEAVWFGDATAGGIGGMGNSSGDSLTASAGGIVCTARAPQLRTLGSSYALVAGAGLLPLGVYVEICTISACPRSSSPQDCLYPPLPASSEICPSGLKCATDEAEAAAAKARAAASASLAVPIAMNVTMRSRYTNVFWSTALCTNGSVPHPRPPLPSLEPTTTSSQGSQIEYEGASASASTFSAATTTSHVLSHSQSCAVLSTTLEGRLLYHGQRPICPHGLLYCDQYSYTPPGVGPSKTEEAVQILRVSLYGFSFIVFIVFSIRLMAVRPGRGGSFAHYPRPPPILTYSLVIRRPKWSIFGSEGQAKAEQLIATQIECPVCLEPFEDGTPNGRPYEVQGCQIHRLCVECAQQWREARADDVLQAVLCPVCRSGAEFHIMRSRASPRYITQDTERTSSSASPTLRPEVHALADPRILRLRGLALAAGRSTLV